MKTLLYIFSLLFVTGIHVRAQSTYLDSTFGDYGIVLSHVGSATSAGSIISVQLLPDHKILAVGNAVGSGIVIRYHENGIIDSSFGVNGIFTCPSYTGIRASVLLADEKIILAGTFQNLTVSNFDFLTMRLKSNGVLDSTFGINGIATMRQGIFTSYHGYAVAIQGDGKIVVAGQSGATSIGVCRFMPGGTTDSSFGVDGIVETSAWSEWAYGEGKGIAVMQDGRIVVGGSCVKGFIAIRMLSDGNPDTTFNHTGIVINEAGYNSNTCHALFLQPDNKPVLSGNGNFGASTGSDFVAIRYNTDGTLDDSFGDTGVVHVDFFGDFDEAWAMCVTPFGGFVLAGNSVVGANENFALARIDSTGKIDSAFCNNGRVTTQIQSDNSRAWAVAMQDDGKIVAPGYSWIGAFPNNYPEITIARYGVQLSTEVEQVIETSGSILLYPNPASGKLHLKTDAKHIKRIEAIGIAGHKTVCVSPQSNIIDISTLVDGVYYFRVYFDNRPSFGQIIQIQNN